MESYDLNTRLPPRKRLLAGSMKDSSDCGFPMSAAPPVSSHLYARLRDLFNSASASQEEMVEASRAAALAAAEVAARARAVAVEKAAVAAAARAAARSALELLDSVARKRARRERLVAKNKGKKKHVAVKHLYTNKQTGEILETDKEVERRLQDESSMCNGVEAKLINRESKYKSEEKVVMHSKMARGVKDRGTKKVKGKRKRLLVSQCGIKDQGKPATEPPTEEPKLDTAKPSGGDEVPMKISSVFNCKKFKVPLHSSDSKIAHTLFSDASAPKASIMVKVD